MNSMRNFNGMLTIFANVMIWIAWKIVKLDGTLEREIEIFKFFGISRAVGEWNSIRGLT